MGSPKATTLREKSEIGFWAKRRAFLPYVTGLLLFVVTKQVERIYRERFDLESPNFTQISTHIIIPEMTSLGPSGRKLSRNFIGL